MAESLKTKLFAIAETVSGTTPNNPAFIAVAYDTQELVSENEWFDNPAKNVNRGKSAGRKYNFSTSATIDAIALRDPYNDLFLLSSVGASAWVEAGTVGVNGDTATAGNSEVTFTLEERIEETPVLRTYHRNAGSKVVETTISCEETGPVNMTYKIAGAKKQTRGTAILAGATYGSEPTALPIMGDECQVTIAGLTVDFLSFELTYGHENKVMRRLTSPDARNVQLGMRDIRLKCKIYRDGTLAVDNLATSDTPVAVTVRIGPATAGAGYSFSLPAMQSVKDAMSTDSDMTEFVEIELMAINDGTGKDMVLTRS